MPKGVVPKVVLRSEATDPGARLAEGRAASWRDHLPRGVRIAGWTCVIAAVPANLFCYLATWAITFSIDDSGPDSVSTSARVAVIFVWLVAAFTVAFPCSLLAYVIRYRSR